ncbi:hypothetical protein D3C87_1810100 [compost metagenome]
MPTGGVLAIDVVAEFFCQGDETFITAHVLNHLPTLMLNNANNIVPTAQPTALDGAARQVTSTRDSIASARRSRFALSCP